MWLPVSTPASPDRRSWRAGQRDEPAVTPRPRRNARHGGPPGTRDRRSHRHRRRTESGHRRRRSLTGERHRCPCGEPARGRRHPRARSCAAPDPLVQAKTRRDSSGTRRASDRAGNRRVPCAQHDDQRRPCGETATGDPRYRSRECRGHSSRRPPRDHTPSADHCRRSAAPLPARRSPQGRRARPLHARPPPPGRTAPSHRRPRITKHRESTSRHPHDPAPTHRRRRPTSSHRTRATEAQHRRPRHRFRRHSTRPRSPPYAAAIDISSRTRPVRGRPEFRRHSDTGHPERAPRH